jgi:hypothetical protein
VINNSDLAARLADLASLIDGAAQDLVAAVNELYDLSNEAVADASVFGEDEEDEEYEEDDFEPISSDDVRVFVRRQSL